MNLKKKSKKSKKDDRNMKFVIYTLVFTTNCTAFPVHNF